MISRPKTIDNNVQFRIIPKTQRKADKFHLSKDESFVCAWQTRYENYSRPSNPFLVPLTKYLDRYATETMDYFLVRERLGRAPTADLLVRSGWGEHVLVYGSLCARLYRLLPARDIFLFSFFFFLLIVFFFIAWWVVAAFGVPLFFSWRVTIPNGAELMVVFRVSVLWMSVPLVASTRTLNPNALLTNRYLLIYACVVLRFGWSGATAR